MYPLLTQGTIRVRFCKTSKDAPCSYASSRWKLEELLPNAQSIPAGQAKQLPPSGSAKKYEPPGHWHSTSLDAMLLPVMLRLSFASQDWHSDEASWSWYWPDGHKSHADLPTTAENVPRAHGDGKSIPASSHSKPRGQGSASAAMLPDGTKLPGLATSQVDFPNPLWYSPAGHRRQASRPMSMKCPGSQARQRSPTSSPFTAKQSGYWFKCGLGPKPVLPSRHSHT
mmetsp:Transcript_52329/g.122524  ORF Transcript_52329/g.122524 Transcript_52329/m.122524 type:complete len:226 (+) Transcript_52329:2798-3475(+)